MACVCNPRKPDLSMQDVLMYCWRTLNQNGTVRISVLPCWQSQVGPQITYQHVRRSPTKTVYLEHTRHGSFERVLPSSDDLLHRLRAVVAQYASDMYLQNEFWSTVIQRRDIQGL